MSRFFIQPKNKQNNLITIVGDDANHIKNVLRLNKGDTITLCDLNEIDYTCKIESICKDQVVALIVSEEKNTNEPNIKITLYQSLPKADKMELIIQKCVELGVHQIVPVITARSIVKLNDKTEKKLERWNKISEAAAKQSRRGKVPIIDTVIDFKTAVNQSKNFDLSFMPYELEKEKSLKNILSNFKGNSIAIFIGAEGGFSNEELSLALNNNIKPITLGKRILRTETAGFVAISIAMYENGEI